MKNTEESMLWVNTGIFWIFLPEKDQRISKASACFSKIYSSNQVLYSFDTLSAFDSWFKSLLCEYCE